MRKLHVSLQLIKGDELKPRGWSHLNSLKEERERLYVFIETGAACKKTHFSCLAKWHVDTIVVVTARAKRKCVQLNSFPDYPLSYESFQQRTEELD